MASASVLVDMDGILADLLPAWIGRYNADYGQRLIPEVIRHWDLDRYVVPECGRDIYRYLRDPDLFRHLDVVPGAVEGVATLQAAGFAVTVASSAAPVIQEAKRAWLAEHFGSALADGLQFMATKADRAADVFIDDSPGQQITYWRTHPTSLIATLAYPYNTEWTGATRFTSWSMMAQGLVRIWERQQARLAWARDQDAAAAAR